MIKETNIFEQLKLRKVPFAVLKDYFTSKISSADGIGTQYCIIVKNEFKDKLKGLGFLPNTETNHKIVISDLSPTEINIFKSFNTFKEVLNNDYGIVYEPIKEFYEDRNNRS